MTKSSYILLLGIAIMILIGSAVWWSTGQEDGLPLENQIATPILNSSSTTSSTIMTSTSTGSR